MGVLRLILAIAVAVGHFPPGYTLYGLTMTPGRLSVQSFYMISGFIITHVFTQKYALLPGGTRLFWINRFLRLWPAFVAVGLATALAYPLSAALGHPVVSHHGLTVYWTDNWFHLTVFTRVILALPNMLIAGTDWVMLWSVSHGHLIFTPRAAGDLWAGSFLLIPQGWSLGIELSFYLVAPWLLRRSWRVLLAVAAASLALRLWTFYGLGLTGGTWTYRVFPQELALFLVGGLSYHCYRWLRPRTSAALFRALGTLTLIALVGGAIFYDRVDGAWRQWAYLTAVPIGLPFLFEFSARSAIDRAIGELSYPMYIVHVGLMPFLFALHWDDSGHGLVLVGTLVGAAMIYVFVERPIDRWRHTLLNRRSPHPDGPRRDRSAGHKAI